MEVTILEFPCFTRSRLLHNCQRHSSEVASRKYATIIDVESSSFDSCQQAWSMRRSSKPFQTHVVAHETFRQECWEGTVASDRPIGSGNQQIPSSLDVSLNTPEARTSPPFIHQLPIVALSRVDATVMSHSSSIEMNPNHLRFIIRTLPRQQLRCVLLNIPQS